MDTHPYLVHPGPVGFAHRGAHGEVAGENSDLAFERAVALGYRHLETDVHRTADGVLVALHDPHLDRTTDARGPVAAARWRDLRTVEVLSGGRVPRLDELLSAWPDVRWNVDCKVAGAADPLVRVVGGDLHRVCVASFDTRLLRRLRRLLGPDACTAATRPEVTAVVAAARLPAALRLVTARALAGVLAADVLQVPVEHEGTTVVDAAFVEVAHAAGLDVHVWTVDDAAEQERLLDLGVDGLVSDDAPGLAGTLAQRGAWPPTDATGRRPAAASVERGGRA